MDEIKRYAFNGDYVLYASHAAKVGMLEKEIASLRETIDELTLFQAQRDGYARQRLELIANARTIESLQKTVDMKDVTIGKRERLITELSEEIEQLKAEIAGWKKYASGINEALNTGDGTYRP